MVDEAKKARRLSDEKKAAEKAVKDKEDFEKRVRIEARKLAKKDRGNPGSI